MQRSAPPTGSGLPLSKLDLGLLVAALILVTLHALAWAFRDSPWGVGAIVATALAFPAWAAIVGAKFSTTRRDAVRRALYPTWLLVGQTIFGVVIPAIAPLGIALAAFLLAGLTNGINYISGATTSLVPYGLFVDLLVGLLCAFVGSAAFQLRR